MKLKKMLAGVLSAALLLAGCGTDNGGNPSTADAPDAEQYINTYVVTDPTSFDSAMATDTIAVNMLINLMEPLLRLEQQADGSLKTVEAGAESYTHSDDGLTWTFTIRENKWSDGQQVTAEDYAYGITRLLDPATAAPYSYLLMPLKNAAAVNSGELPVEELGVKALDEKTLEIQLEGPTSYFMGLLYHTVMLPARKDLVEQYGDQYGTAIDKMAYNGPFKAESWVHNSEIVFVKNDQYWDNASVKLGKITYKVIQDENAVYSSLENGSIDTASTLSKEWTDAFSQNSRLVHEKVVSANTYYQYYNQTDPLFANANVRKAFTLAVDREDLNDVIYDGMRIPAYSMIPNGITSGDTEYASIAKQPIKTLQESTTASPKELLVQGLTELGMDPDPAKLTVTLSLGGTDQFTKTLAEYMQQTYKTELGVQVQIEMLDWGAFIDNYYNLDYQIGQMAFGAEWNDPLSMLTCVESSQDGYCIGWGSEEVDALLAKATASSDETQKVALIEQIEDIFLNQDGCVCPLVFSASDLFTYDYVKGVEYATFSTSGYKYVYTQGRK